MRTRFRFCLEFEVDRDMVPGWGQDPEDFMRWIRTAAETGFPHYKPTVKATSSVLVMPNGEQFVLSFDTFNNESDNKKPQLVTG